MPHILDVVAVVFFSTASLTYYFGHKAKRSRRNKAWIKFDRNMGIHRKFAAILLGEFAVLVLVMPFLEPILRKEAVAPLPRLLFVPHLIFIALSGGLAAFLFGWLTGIDDPDRHRSLGRKCMVLIGMAIATGLAMRFLLFK